MEESRAAIQRSKDLTRLAAMARSAMPTMDVEDQLEVLALLRIKVEILSTVPTMTHGNPCPVRTWFSTAGRQVPVEVPDEAWEQISPLIVKTGRGHGKKTAYDPRQALEATLWKARNQATWEQAAVSMGRSGKSLSPRFNTWVAEGVWEQIVDLLAGVDAVELPLPPSRVLPDLLVTGEIDPRLLLKESHIGDHAVPSSTTMSWQAAITVSAMPGRPCRRAAPGFWSGIS